MYKRIYNSFFFFTEGRDLAHLIQYRENGARNEGEKENTGDREDKGLRFPRTRKKWIPGPQGR